MVWTSRVRQVSEQFEDIMDRLCGDNYTFSLDIEEKENEFGGNPHRKVTFNMNANDIPYKEKVFNWHMASQTENGFINEIKAYLLDTLDAVVNL